MQFQTRDRYGHVAPTESSDLVEASRALVDEEANDRQQRREHDLQQDTRPVSVSDQPAPVEERKRQREGDAGNAGDGSRASNLLVLGEPGAFVSCFLLSDRANQ